MAGELWAKGDVGLTVYVHLWSGNLVWNGSAFVAYNEADWASYAVNLTQQGTSGYYAAGMPAGVTTPGPYSYVAYQRVGGSPAVGDAPFFLGTGSLDWDGAAVVTPATAAAVSSVKAKTDQMTFTSSGKIDAKLTADGLDNISVADPGGVSNMTTLPRLVVALWRRWYKKSKLTRVSAGVGSLTLFADDGSTTNVTQSYSEDLTQQTLGPGA